MSHERRQVEDRAHRLRRTIAVVMLAAAVAACAKPSAPNDNDDDAIAGTYKLVVDFNDQPLWWSAIKGGELSLHTDGTFTDRLAMQSGGQPSYTHVATGLYEVINGAVELRYSDRRPVVYDTAGMSDGTLAKGACKVWNFCEPGELRYRK